MLLTSFILCIYYISPTCMLFLSVTLLCYTFLLFLSVTPLCSLYLLYCLYQLQVTGLYCLHELQDIWSKLDTLVYCLYQLQVSTTWRLHVSIAYTSNNVYYLHQLHFEIVYISHNVLPLVHYTFILLTPVTRFIIYSSFISAASLYCNNQLPI